MRPFKHNALLKVVIGNTVPYLDHSTDQGPQIEQTLFGDHRSGRLCQVHHHTNPGCLHSSSTSCSSWQWPDNWVFCHPNMLAMNMNTQLAGPSHSSAFQIQGTLKKESN